MIVSIAPNDPFCLSAMLEGAVIEVFVIEVEFW
jgi:hypothetical protein